ncbi:MAG TPA: tRNA (N(6)-L-threonylcarbamoyladenosine(37)-C(2))-methylthiotransferase MtaB [Clostridia bacterium]|nr:tRNA (N(6)-L-threonylcarbamoyladenosine(37)-C(2))-methylthiotransferase MtaB [Clostridia bacterium]
MNNKNTIAVFTLGCKTNSYESGQIAAALRNSGYNVFEGLVFADIYVLNTCAVTAEAEGKSRQAIARAKKLNPNCKIIVTGCAAEKNALQFKNIPNVTFIRGNADKIKIAQMVENIGVSVSPIEKKYIHFIDSEQAKTRAYIKIQDGCDNYCSYCIVPYLRGQSRSRSVISIVNEIKSLKAKEYVLNGIDISQYGKDIGTTLSQLLVALHDIDARIRLGSIYQNVIDDELLFAMKKNVCKHLHLSLQSGCDKVLKSMNRHYTTEQYYETVKKIRHYYPDCGITTDIIVGFPTETEEDFFETCEFTKKVGFSDIHIFPYSPRKGTKAYELGKIESDVMKVRVEKLTNIKKQLKDSFIEKFLGKMMGVLVEEKKSGFYVGYTDNYIRVYIGEKVKIGEIVEVTLTEKYKEGVLGVL